MNRILIIEDDRRITSALSVRLGAAGYEVACAADGFDGLKQAVSQPPDLILMDIVMPVGLGFSVVERLKAIGLGRIPVIFITASKRTGLRKTANELGAAGFFEKPYDSGELLSAIALVLGSTPIPIASAAQPQRSIP